MPLWVTSPVAEASSDQGQKSRWQIQGLRPQTLLIPQKRPWRDVSLAGLPQRWQWPGVGSASGLLVAASPLRASLDFVAKR